MKTTKIKKAPSKANYEAIIRVFGKIYKANGSTPIEAISNLKVTGKAAGASVLAVSNGKDKRDRILNSGQVMRLFSQSKLMREIALKNLSMLFNL